GRGDPRSVSVRPVGRAEVLDHELPALARVDPRVDPRYLAVAAEVSEPGRRAPDDQLVREPDARAGGVAGDDAELLGHRCNTTIPRGAVQGARAAALHVLLEPDPPLLATLDSPAIRQQLDDVEAESRVPGSAASALDRHAAVAVRDLHPEHVVVAEQTELDDVARLGRGLSDAVRDPLGPAEQDV